MSAANSGARNTSVEARSRQIVMFALRLGLNESSQKVISVISFKLTGHMEQWTVVASQSPFNNYKSPFDLKLFTRSRIYNPGAL